jgi:integrase
MRKRRGRGEGSVFQRKAGLWVGTLTVGYDQKGKRRRRAVYGATKAEVLDKLTRLQHQALTGMLSDPQRLTVAVFLAKWLEDAARPAIQASTHRRYGEVIRLHVGPSIGGTALSRLTPAHVQGMLIAMEKGGASARVRQMTFNVLHRALGQALRWGMVPRNVCDAVARPRVPRRTMRTLDAGQVRLLLAEAKADRLEALYVLAVSTGMRQGELLGLQWEDVGLDRGVVQVRHQLQELAGRLTLVEPKTVKSRRQVDLPALAVMALMEHRERVRAPGRSVGEGYVFTDTEGGPLRKSNLLRRSFFPLLNLRNLREDLRKQGVAEEALPKPLPRIRFHDLRHTAATLHLTNGTHPKVVQEMLGHSTISMTLDTYSHTVPSMQKEAAARLDALLRPAP